MRSASTSLVLSTVLGILSIACGQNDETINCCYVVAEKETCAGITNGGYEQVGNVGSSSKLDGVDALLCCEDPSATMNMDGEWCTGSAGASEEVTVPSNTITEISSNSSVVESHTEEHSESHTEESHTETSTTTTTTTDGSASTTCNMASGLCICTGTCPAETSNWGSIIQQDSTCVATKVGGEVSTSGDTVIVNGQSYNPPFDTCPGTSAAAMIGTSYYTSVFVASAVVGGVMVAAL